MKSGNNGILRKMTEGIIWRCGLEAGKEVRQIGCCQSIAFICPWISVSISYCSYNKIPSTWRAKTMDVAILEKEAQNQLSLDQKSRRRQGDCHWRVQWRRICFPASLSSHLQTLPSSRSCGLLHCLQTRNKLLFYSFNNCLTGTIGPTSESSASFM